MGGADVVFAQHLQQAGARQAGDDGREPSAQRDGRQDEVAGIRDDAVLQGHPLGDRQPVERQRKDPHQQRPQHDRRHRHAEDGDKRCRAILPAPAVQRGNNARGQPDRQGKEQGEDAQLRRNREARQQKTLHRFAALLSDGPKSSWATFFSQMKYCS